jgi:predicted DNA-binding protein YlxM (UPF0122 family)
MSWDAEQVAFLVKHYKKDLSTKQIAEKLGKTESAIYSFIKRNNLSSKKQKKTSINIEVENDLFIKMKNTYEEKAQAAEKTKKDIEEYEALKKRMQEISKNYVS